MTQLMTTIYDPRAEAGVAAECYDLAVDVKTKNLRIGLVSNGFPDATNLLNEVGAALEQILDSPRIKVYARRDATRHVTPEELQEIIGESDAVVTAMGHCGSCTSSTVRDSVLIARGGVPAVSLITTKFWDSANFVARSVGMPGVPRVKLPYPVAGSGAANVSRVANGAVDDVIRQLGALQ